MPGDQVLLSPRTVLGHSTDLALNYGALHLLCQSDSDSSTGRCPVRGSANSSGARSTVYVRFKERRSGLTADLAVQGWLERVDAVATCSPGYWQGVERELWSSAGGGLCAGRKPAGTGAALALPSEQLRNLVAGRWDAVLVLALHKDESSGELARYTFVFDLTVTDHDRVSIYFPEYDQATPHVGLNVKYNPFPTPTIAGRRELEMCLYDGLGSQSNYLEVTISDSGRVAPGRPLDRFSVWHEGGGGAERDRLDYKIQLQHAGVPISMENGRLQPLSGIDTADLRLVVLPGMSQPVYCVPTPLTLEMPRVDASTKANGYYSGNLRILMNVPTTTP
ncbi:CfaE/CblD family pilus tip adhesin [Stenotrophomonas sp. PUT21]|uniref:CfaE/CblD family pilus tip adhesin n=1 Tax=Stenotrophomonas TaxID=40323 RepID=UPI003B7DDF12